MAKKKIYFYADLFTDNKIYLNVRCRIVNKDHYIIERDDFRYIKDISYISKKKQPQIYNGVPVELMREEVELSVGRIKVDSLTFFESSFSSRNFSLYVLPSNHITTIFSDTDLAKFDVVRDVMKKFRMVKVSSKPKDKANTKDTKTEIKIKTCTEFTGDAIFEYHIFAKVTFVCNVEGKFEISKKDSQKIFELEQLDKYVVRDEKTKYNIMDVGGANVESLAKINIHNKNGSWKLEKFKFYHDRMDKITNIFTKEESYLIIYTSTKAYEKNQIKVYNPSFTHTTASEGLTFNVIQAVPSVINIIEEKRVVDAKRIKAEIEHLSNLNHVESVGEVAAIANEGIIDEEVVHSTNKDSGSTNGHKIDNLDRTKEESAQYNRIDARFDAENSWNDFTLDYDNRPSRVETMVNIAIRNQTIVSQIKAVYNNTCQLCRERVQVGLGEYMSEAHHIRPLGKVHEGPDIIANLIVLCPNHHTMFDRGAITIELETRKIIHIDPKHPLNHKQIHLQHYINQDFIIYHNQYIYQGNKKKQSKSTKHLSPVHHTMRVSDPNTVDYGDLVSVQDSSTNEIFEVKLEAQYNKSFMQPLGSALLNKQLNEIFVFNSYSYKVIHIQKEYIIST